jgi:osmotically-inducible protein OsmY
MSSDRELQEAVLAQLLSQAGVTAAHIGVTANAGVVTLNGHVDQYWQKGLAEQAAARAAGVDAVVDALEVRLPIALKRSDEDIARAVIDRLAWTAAVPRGCIGLVVEDGVVTLTGEVEWPYQQAAAERTVRELIGVVGINDRTTLRPCASPAHISAEIDAALHHSRDEPSTITVTAEGDHVTLSGTVQTPAERDLAGETAEESPGARVVDNELVVA